MEEGSGGYGALSEVESEKPKSFKEAFAEARSSGDKTFTWQGKRYSTETAGSSRTVSPSGSPGGAYRGHRADSGSAEIPRGSETAPASTGEDTSGPSNLDRVMMGLPVAGGIAGAAKLAQMRRAKQAAETAKAAAAKFSSPQARQATAETGRRFGAQAEMEAAESTLRGAVGRKDIQAKRAAAAKGRAEVMEANKPVLQATPKKPSPRAKTRDEEMDYEMLARGGKVGKYASGGKVRGGGCEMRGKTRGVMR